MISFKEIIQFLKRHQEEIILVVGVILISLLSFAMGYITAKQENKKEIKIEVNNQLLISNKFQV